MGYGNALANNEAVMIATMIRYVLLMDLAQLSVRRSELFSETPILFVMLWLELRRVGGVGRRGASGKEEARYQAEERET